MIELTFNGEVPSKKNSKKIVCRGARPILLPSSNYEAWHTEQMYRLNLAKHEKIEQPVSVSLRYFPGSLRRCDLTNRAESIMDILVDAGILVDDSWKWVPSVTMEFIEVDRENPRMEVIIQEINE